MARRSRPTHVGDSANGTDLSAARSIAKKAARATKAQAKAQSKVTAAESKIAAARAKAAERAARAAGEQARKTADAASKHRREESAAERKASKAAAKAAKASAKASAAEAKAAATRPARAIQKVTDPKVAKRAMMVGKILAPVLAPFLIKAAAGVRGALDGARARQLGVPVGQVAAFRGPTGPAGARISGLTEAVHELAARKGNDLQITRFADVAGARLRDLTAAVQASATMPRPRRTELLRAVDRELDEIDADLVTHLMAPRPR